MKKIFKISFIAVPLILLAVVCGLYMFYRFQKVAYNKNIRGDVKADTTISRNTSGIPVIQASTMEDIYFSMGFVHGQDRLDVMEYYRALASGGSSSFYGKPGDPMDRIVRVLGIPLKARTLLEKLQKPYKDYIEAYANGVNLARRKSKMRREIRRDWNSADVISISLLLDICRSYMNNMENIFQFPENVSKSLLKTIFPENYLYFYNKEDEKNIILIRKIRDIIGRSIALDNSGFSIFLGPRSTKTGAPVTAYSYSSNISIYPAIYPLEIHYGDIKIDGITMTGLPFIYSGSNQRINFFNFNLKTDTQDFILEKVQMIDGVPHYLGVSGWKKFSTVRVPMYDADGSEINELIPATDNGPVLNAIFKEDKYNDNVVTLKMISPKEDYIQALFDIPFSDTVQKAANFVKNLNSLPRVYLFSDSQRSIKSYSGKIPLRAPSTSVFKTGYHPELDFSVDISAYTFVNEYQAMAGSDYLTDAPPVVKNSSLYLENVSGRITRLLEKKTTDAAKDIMNILKDSHSQYAEKFVPKFLVLLGNNPITSARLTRIYLNDWNFRMDADLIAPSIFSVILKNFIYETYADEINAADQGGINPMDYIIGYYNLLCDKFYKNAENPTTALFDNINTDGVETIGMTFDRAFVKSMRFLNRKKGPIMENWKWGDIHKGHFMVSGKRYTALTEFLYKVKDQGLDGGLSSSYNGIFNDNFEPVEITSLMGVFNTKNYKLFMNYAVSTNPFSDFFYGTFSHSDASFADYRSMPNLYSQIISPLK